jgi:hypothetical protein
LLCTTLASETAGDSGLDAFVLSSFFRFCD